MFFLIIFLLMFLSMQMIRWRVSKNIFYEPVLELKHKSMHELINQKETVFIINYGDVMGVLSGLISSDERWMVRHTQQKQNARN